MEVMYLVNVSFVANERMLSYVSSCGQSGQRILTGPLASRVEDIQFCTQLTHTRFKWPQRISSFRLQNDVESRFSRHTSQS